MLIEVKKIIILSCLIYCVNEWYNTGKSIAKGIMFINIIKFWKTDIQKDAWSLYLISTYKINNLTNNAENNIDKLGQVSLIVNFLQNDTYLAW